MENRKRKLVIYSDSDSDSDSDSCSDECSKPLDMMAMLKDSLSSTITQCLDRMKLSKAERSMICSMTEQQCRNRDWHNYRFGRITASNVGEILGAIERKSYPPSLFKRLEGGSGQDLSFVPAIQWGLQNESRAIHAFGKLKPYWDVQKAGLCLDSSGIMGASPDAMLECNGSKAVLEVKCPYKHRESNDLHAAAQDDKNFCLSATDGLLKIGHPYWHQVQTQMYVCKVSRAFFVVWTKNAVHCEEITRNKYWRKIVPLEINKFYRNIYLPHLMEKYSSSSSSSKSKSDDSPLHHPFV
jgi:hypothetical protein